MIGELKNQLGKTGEVLEQKWLDMMHNYHSLHKEKILVIVLWKV